MPTLATSQPMRKARTATTALLMTTAALCAATPAEAITFLNEATFFISGSQFTPGAKAQTQVIFATAPALELSAFAFELSWSSDLATPLLTGSRSVAELAATLGTRGVFETHSGGLHVIAGSWRANSLAPSTDIITVSNTQHLLFSFDFQTDPALTGDFAVAFDLNGLKDGVGDPIDIGSGLFSSVVLSPWQSPPPVPEPGSWVLLLAGLAVTAAAARRRSR